MNPLCIVCQTNKTPLLCDLTHSCTFYVRSIYVRMRRKATRNPVAGTQRRLLWLENLVCVYLIFHGGVHEKCSIQSGLSFHFESAHLFCTCSFLKIVLLLGMIFFPTSYFCDAKKNPAAIPWKYYFSPAPGAAETTSFVYQSHLPSPGKLEPLVFVRREHIFTYGLRFAKRSLMS